MQYLKQIVTAINASIAAKFDDVRFQGSEFNGIAVSAVKKMEDSEETTLAPLITDDYDDNRWVGIDDTFPIRLYHKTNTFAYVDLPMKGYGDGGNTGKRETAQMSIICYGNRAMIRLTPEELEGAIVAGLPSALRDTITSALKIHSCVIRPTGSTLDPVNVFLTEYRTKDYRLPPNALLIRVNYNIESTYKTACFNICDC